MKRVINNKDPRKSTIKEVMTSRYELYARKPTSLKLLAKCTEENIAISSFAAKEENRRHRLYAPILGLAVELGQGMSETKTLAGLVSGGVLSVDEGSSVYETIDLMIQRGVASIVVSVAGKPAAIFTERDVLKRVAAKGIDTRKLR